MTTTSYASQIEASLGTFPKPNHAFGVNPRGRRYYSLRHSRYDALAQDISEWAGAAARAGRALTVLDVGCSTGLALRHLEAKPHFGNLAVSAADLKEQNLYKRHLYREFFTGDLMHGFPQIPPDAYDAVICEQVLEHLAELPVAIATLERVLRPGGRLIVGVPIFVPALAIMRRHVVPVLDRITRRRKPRGHVQAFSMGSFLREMRRNTKLQLIEVRGLRIISGGILRPLENYRWWWKLNRWLGAKVPGYCIEIQAIMEKPASENSRRRVRGRPRGGCVMQSSDATLANKAFEPEALILDPKGATTCKSGIRRPSRRSVAPVKKGPMATACRS